MAEGLIDIVEPRLNIKTSTTSTTPKERSNRWVKIYESERNIVRGLFIDMEIIGKKVNLINEKNTNLRLCGDYAATIIQKNIRRYLNTLHQ